MSTVPPRKHYSLRASMPTSAVDDADAREQFKAHVTSLTNLGFSVSVVEVYKDKPPRPLRME